MENTGESALRNNNCDNVSSEDEDDSNREQDVDNNCDNVSSEDEDDSNREQDVDNNFANHVSDKTKVNPGWADAMRRILCTKKPKRKKTIVLSKAKKLCDIVSKERKEPLPFEIENIDGIIKNTLERKEFREEKETKDKKRKRKEVKTGIRVKPSMLNRERERTLQKIATKGVVQLFNVVRQQQMEIDKKLVEAGPLERKREKVLKVIDKRVFLDVLMGGTKSIQIDHSKTETKKENEDLEGKKVWKVLRDDFVMGASLKDWNKKAPEQENSSTPEEIESDE